MDDSCLDRQCLYQLNIPDYADPQKHAHGHRGGALHAVDPAGGGDGLRPRHGVQEDRHRALRGTDARGPGARAQSCRGVVFELLPAEAGSICRYRKQSLNQTNHEHTNKK